MTDAHRPRPGRPDGPVGGHASRLFLALAIWVFLAAAGTWGQRPPAPAPVDAPETAFSAERALTVLATLRGDGRPHPAGSAANAAVIERIERELARMGLESFRQQTFVVAPNGRAGRVTNLTAVVGGMRPPPYVMISVHHDSVGAGPGVADDLAGIATALESVRALRARGTPEYGILLLFTDAEEVALAGAEAFCLENDLMDQVACTINLEARGVRGPSRLFETGPDSGHLVRAWSRGVARPNGTAIAAEVYRRMNNDSDLSVFRSRGLPGLNFAFIGGVEHYHTPGDDLAQLDLASLQHHGENVVGVLAGLMAAETLEPDPAAPVFFDLFGRLGVVLGERLVLVLALLAALAALWGAHLAARAGVVRWGRLAVAYLWLPVIFIAPVVGTEALLLALERWLGPDPGNARPWALRLFAFGGVSTFATLVIALAGRSVRPTTLALAAFGSWSLFGLLAAVFVPGGAYLFLAPALVVAVPAIGVRLRGDVDARFGRISLFALAAAVLMWTPLRLGLEEVVGTRAAFATTAPVAALVTLAAPLLVAAPGWARRAVGGLGGLALVGGLAMVMLQHGPTAERPQRMTLVEVQDEAGDVWHLREPAAVHGAAVEVLGAAPRATARLEDVEVSLRPDGSRRVTGRILSPSGALHLFLEPRGDAPLLEARFEGRRVPLARPRPSLLEDDHDDGDQRPTGIELFALPPEGYAFEWTYGPGPAGRAGWSTEEEVLGLEAAELLWRPARYVPSDRGDRRRLHGALGLDLPASP